MKFERFVGLLAVAALILAIATVAVHAGDKLSVGDFVTMVANAKGLPAGSAQEASGSLTGSGYKLPGLNLDAVLTEGDVVSISKSVGITLTTSTPTQEFDRDQATSYFASLSGEFGTGNTPGEGDPETNKKPNPGTDKGKGKKVGHFKSPSEPE